MPHRTLLALALLACIGLGAAPQAPALKSLMPPGVRIGAALNWAQISGADARALALVTTHVNSISPENVLKWESVHPTADRYDFAAADRYVALGERHGMEVVGHTLVWHQQTPEWVFTDARGAKVDRATALARLRNHLTTVVGRYRGRIHGWDVVNEALAEDGSLRDAPWRRALGDDYVAEAFALAHAADPSAELYYADYNLFRPEKRAGALRLIRDLRRRGIRIDGVGVHAHWGLDRPSLALIREMIEDFHARGVAVMISELDVSVLPRPPKDVRALDDANRSHLDPYAQGLPPKVQRELADRYADIFRVVLENQDAVTRVTLWGVTDRDSWLNDYPLPGRTNHPLLWDRQGVPKPAFNAVVDVLQAGR